VTATGTAAVVAATFAVALLGASGCNQVFRFDEPLHTDGGEDGGDLGTAVLPCTSDATCGGLRCDVPSGECVACLADAECSGSTPRCEPKSHLCVPCLAGNDCPARQGCDTVTHRCLDICVDGDDVCPGVGFICDRSRSLCIECKTSANCAGSTTGRVCDVPIGRCVECTGNAQCPTSKPACDRRSGRCVACLASSACGAGAVCDPVALACRSAP
jgi:Cys-rich repeat protein